MSDFAMAAADSPTEMGAAARRFVRHASPRTLIAALSLLLVARFAVADWSLADLAVVATIALFWPVQEWMIHVFILHFEPFEVFGRTFDFEVPRSHRTHHRDPWNLDILFIPLQGYFLGVPPLLILAFGLLPTTGLALTAVTFYLALSLNYEWWHFIVHTRVKPRGALHRRLWRNHRLHHCKNEHYWFGVTMLAGDRLLGTAPDVGAVETSPTCRTLGAEDTLAGDGAAH